MAMLALIHVLCVKPCFLLNKLLASTLSVEYRLYNPAHVLLLSARHLQQLQVALVQPFSP